ncbi:carbohydrate ABC transporter permease [Propionibacteriaceae bacterium Y2011]|uniref:carbohydrate ABC transporter permease n=1 Tax=Microlunatus sp. Y2014 TaxID=3418488 RepID=UPI003B477038
MSATPTTKATSLPDRSTTPAPSPSSPSSSGTSPSATSRASTGMPWRRRIAYNKVNFWWLFLVPFCIVWIYPFAWMVSSAFKSQREMLLGGISLIPTQPTIDNFVRAWTVARFGEYTMNTITFSVTVVLIVLLVSSTSGYALGRGRMPGKYALVGLLVATMFIPHGYTIIPVYQLVQALGLSNGLLGAVLAAAGPAHVIQIMLFMGYFAGLPDELGEAARIDGAGYLRTFFSIYLPLSKPIMGTVALFNFIGAWNAFMVPLVFTLGRPDLRTLGVGMYGFFGADTTDWTGLAAGACISIVPIVIVFLLLQKTFVEGIAGAVKF